MATKPPSRGVKVRGTCKDGHTTETTSKPGRVTWQGPCAHDGCDLKVYARRVPRDRSTPADNAPADAPAGDPTTVKEVAYDVPPKKRERRAGRVVDVDTGDDPGGNRGPDDQSGTGPGDVPRPDEQDTGPKLVDDKRGSADDQTRRPHRRRRLTFVSPLD